MNEATDQDRRKLDSLIAACQGLEDEVRNLSANPQGFTAECDKVWNTVARAKSWPDKVSRVIGHRESLKHMLRNMQEARFAIISAVND